MSNSVKKKFNKAKAKSVLPFKQQQRIKNRSRATPWHNTAEFDYVGRCLSHALSLFPSSHLDDDDDDDDGDGEGSCFNYENDASQIMPLDDDAYNELQYAIHRVSSWRQRAENTRLPHSLDVGASLAEILLQDACHQQNSQFSHTMAMTMTMTTTSAISLRLSYASNIIRAVNGIADAMQRNRSINGSSVSHLCSLVGLPSWIVDLRHDSAHNELPSLIALRLAAKSLMGFLIEKYWMVLEDQRLTWAEDGVGLLMECKKALKALDRQNLQKGEETAQDVDLEVAEEHPSDDDGDDNDDDEEEEEEEEQERKNIYGAYSIFAEVDEREPKKSNASNKKKNLSASSSFKPNQNIPKSITSNASAKKNIGRTPRQCINEFMKKIPLDTGINVLISYLVFGGVGDAPDQRGILIPGSPTTFPETIESVRKIRDRYSLAVIAFAAKWPGFVHTLLVSIVEFILVLESAKSNTAVTSRGDEPIDEAGGAVCLEEAGRQRKLYFLLHWVRYLLSNEFYYFLGWLDITFKGSKNMRQRPREKWSDELLSLMESNAPLEVLQIALLPLNSICDRCILEGDGSETSKEIVSLLRNALGKERAKGVVLKYMDELGPRGNGNGNGNKRSGTKMKSPSIESNGHKDRAKKARLGESKMLSLEEMEGLLSDENECANETKTDAIEMCTSSVENEQEPHQAKETTNITPWKLCSSWDACAIGTLPGYTYI